MFESPIEALLPPEKRFDPAPAVDHIVQTLRKQVTGELARRGAVVAISGGVDSSVTLALAVEAFGPKRVFGLMLPELDSDPDSTSLATRLATQLGIDYEVKDISGALSGAGCYERRDAAIASIVPGYGDGWRCKLVLGKEGGSFNITRLVVVSPDGEQSTVRLTAAVYREVVAATNFKQRTRKMLEYFHGDRLHYAVFGTPNRLEYDQGFFVKGGDGLADTKPIAHLYKYQVYRVGEKLGVLREILERPPTTDTFSLPQTQGEFYYGLPTMTFDQVLLAYDNRIQAAETARALDESLDSIEEAYRDIDQKRRATRYLHLSPLLMAPIDSIQLAPGSAH